MNIEHTKFDSYELICPKHDSLAAVLICFGHFGIVLLSDTSTRIYLHVFDIHIYICIYVYITDKCHDISGTPFNDSAYLPIQPVSCIGPRQTKAKTCGNLAGIPACRCRLELSG